MQESTQEVRRYENAERSRLGLDLERQIHRARRRAPGLGTDRSGIR